MKEKMTSRERLTTVLRGGEPDRIPWSPLISKYYMNSVFIDGKNPDQADAARMMGADHLERHVEVANSKIVNVDYELIQKGNEELERYSTPVGVLEQISEWAGHTRFIKDFMVKSVDDLKILKYIIEHTCYEPYFEPFLEREAYIGHDGLATASVNGTPIKTMMDYFTGLENFTYLLYDFESDMREVMDMIHIKHMDLLKITIDSPAEFIFIYEDTSTTVLSRNWYKDFCMDYINEYAGLVHKAGKTFITHMCGKLKGFIDLLDQGQMDGIDSVCPPDTGDLWAHEALSALPGKLIIGGIEPPALERMSAVETESYVRNVLEAVAPGKHFILSTGDAVAYGTPMENLRKVSEVVVQWGKYPII